MGVVKNIDYDNYPKQADGNYSYTSVGKRVAVYYRYDTDRCHYGTIVRDDIEEPGVTVIALDNGRYLLSTECQYRELESVELAIPLRYFEELRQKQKELKMWQEYKQTVKGKSLEKDRTEYLAIQLLETEAKVDTIMGKLQENINLCINFINSVEKSDVRQAMFYKFIDGKSWVQIGFKLDTTDEAIGIKVRRYMKKAGIR